MIDTGARDLRVLMVGPPVESAGGMSAVTEALREGLRASSSTTRLRFVDSGGGLGWAGYWRFPRALFEVARLRPDVLHVHVASRGSTVRKALLAAIARAQGIPYVIHLHGGGYGEFVDGLSPWARRSVRSFFAHASHIIVLGRTWRDLVVDALRVRPERVTIIPNGVAEVGPADPGSRTILFIGAVTVAKGADTLVAAAHRLLDDSSLRGWRVKLVGPTPDPVLLRVAAEGPASSHIVFAGPLFGAAKNEAIREAAVLVLPSRTEALPMVILEAMSAGLPCVCTRVGSIPDVVEDGISGLLFDAGDVEALAGALTKVASDPDLRARMGARGHARWKADFTQEALARCVHGVWTDAVTNRH